MTNGSCGVGSRMAVIVDPDSLVAGVGLYRYRHWMYHGYVAPFLLFLYPLWAYLSLFGGLEAVGFVFDQPLPVEAAVIGAVVVAFFQVLMILSCMWSVHVSAFLTCTKVNNIKVRKSMDL